MSRGQFFIVTIVLVTISITLTALSLYVPKEINVNRVTINEKSIDNLFFAKQVLNDVSNYFKVNWLLPYTHRTVISTQNNFTLNDYTVMAGIDLPDNTYVDSLTLVDSMNNKALFNVEWANLTSRQGTIYFQSSAEALDNKKYYLYYNTAPGMTIKPSQDKSFTYGETADNFWVRTNSYYVNITKKNGGSIKSLSLSGSDDLLVSIDNFITCGAQYNLTSASNKAVTLTDMDYYLKAVFTGNRFGNESYEVTELFLPDRIVIIDSMTIAAESTCSAWGSMLIVNNESLMNFVDSNGNRMEPADDQGTTFVSNGKWFELYGDYYGIGMASSNTSPIYASASSTLNRGEIRFNTSPVISKGTYTSNVTIIPLVGARLEQTKQYSNPSSTTVNEAFTTEYDSLFSLIDRFFYDLNAVVTVNKSIGYFHEPFKNLNDWQGNYSFRDNIFISGPDRLVPLEFDVALAGGADTNSLITYDNGRVPSQVSTDNYIDGSSFINPLNNTVVNNSLLLFNPNGQAFAVTINNISAGTIGVNAYKPNGSLINYYDVNSDPYDININIGEAGFYNLTFNGTATFTVNSSLPKTVAGLPVSVMSTNAIYLFVNQSINNTNLDVTSQGISQAFTLFDEFNNSVGLNDDVTPCAGGCVYRLEVNTAGPFTVNSNNKIYASTNEAYIINPLEPRVRVINVNTASSSKRLTIYYDVNSNASPVNSASDLVYSESDNEVNNSFFSFDLDAMSFEYLGVDWLAGRGWVTCADDCTDSFSSIRFVEKGSERVVVEANTSVGVTYHFLFYPNTSYFKVITNTTTNYSFGPSWSVNGTTDLYYSFKDSAELSLGSNNFVDKFNLTGPTNYGTKSDGNSSASVIFETNKLEYNNSLKFNNTAIIIRAVLPGTFAFIINENPNSYLTRLTSNQVGMLLNFTYEDSLLTFKGHLFT